MNDMIFAYFIGISNHMWADENTPARFYGMPGGYTETNDIDIPLWDETMAYLSECGFNMVVVDVGDGVKFESHPEISAPDAWSKEFLQKKLDELRTMGIIPIPKLNFSACHDTWLKEYRRMISSKTYYKVCDDLIDEVCELFGKPEYFHLGLDEEDYDNQLINEAILIRGENLWWHDCGLLFDRCEKNGARPWVWSDYYWRHPDLFVKHMPKSVLQSNWYYGDITPELREGTYAYTASHAYKELSDLGYDLVPTSSTWANNRNTFETFRYCKDVVSPERLKGFMTAPWTEVRASEKYTLLNDAYRFLLARREVYPESI